MPYRHKHSERGLVLHIRVPWDQLAYLLQALQAEGLPTQGLSLSSIVRAAVRNAAEAARARHNLPEISLAAARSLVQEHQQMEEARRAPKVPVGGLSETLVQVLEEDSRPHRLAPIPDLAERAARLASAKLADSVRQAAEIESEPDRTPPPGGASARHIPFSTLRQMGSCAALDRAAEADELARRACEIVLSGVPPERWSDAETAAAVSRMEHLLREMAKDEERTARKKRRKKDA